MTARERSQAVWLVDLENTGSRWAHAARLFQAGDLVAMFWSTKSCVPDIRAMSSVNGVKYMFIECQNGTPNAMDFQLTAWLGMAAMTNPDHDFIILSGDSGYTPLEKFMRKLGVSVMIIDPNMARETENDITPEPEEPVSYVPVKAPDPDASIENTYDAVHTAYIDKLQNAGVSDRDELRIFSAILMQAMQQPQNRRKLDVRNRLMAKYGAKDGTAKYNGIKTVVHDIATNGPYPAPAKPTPIIHGLTTNAVNMALSKAGITLKTGQVAKSMDALKAARACSDKVSKTDSLYKAVPKIFDKEYVEKAFGALKPFLAKT